MPIWTNVKEPSLEKNGANPRGIGGPARIERASLGATSRPLPDSFTARGQPHSRVFLPLVDHCQCQLVGAQTGAQPTAQLPSSTWTAGTWDLL